MKNIILKYLGVFLMLIGVIVFAVYHFGGYAGNALLVVGGVFVVVGTISYIVLNKYID